MQTVEKIKQDLEHLETLVSQIIPDEAESVLSYGQELSAWLGTSAKLVADTRYYQDKAVRETMIKMNKDGSLTGLSPSLAKDYIKAVCLDFNYLVNTAERLNSAIVHRCDYLRSQLSYLKQERYHSQSNIG